MTRSDYLSKFTITSIKWYYPELAEELPLTWNLLEETGWKIFDQSYCELSLCKDNWKLHVCYLEDLVVFHSYIFWKKEGSEGYYGVGTFEINVIERKRDHSMITKEDNEKYCLGLPSRCFPEDEKSESEEDLDLEEMLQLASKLKKMLKKKLNK